MDATASRGAATPGIALAGMLADSVAVHSGATYEGTLLYVFRPASAMPGFPPPSGKDYKKGDVAIGTSPNKGWGRAVRHTL